MQMVRKVLIKRMDRHVTMKCGDGHVRQAHQYGSFFLFSANIVDNWTLLQCFGHCLHSDIGDSCWQLVVS